MVKAIWNGVVLAESDDTVIVEGNHYFPRSALNPDYFVESARTSRCGWKGTANYLTVLVGGKQNRDAAWFYASPSTAAAAIKDRVAFWRVVKVVDDSPSGETAPARAGGGILAWLGHRPPEDDEAPSLVSELDDATFATSTTGGWTLVDFWAPWCGPCRAFHPMFERAPREHAGQGPRFLRLDIDGNPRTAAMVGIQSIPTLVLFDPEGNEVGRVVGVPSLSTLDDLIHAATPA